MNKVFWKCAAIRAVKTMAQGAVALIGTSQVSIVSLDWPQIIGCVATMGMLSLLTSLAGLPEVEMSEEMIDEEAMDYAGGEDDEVGQEE